MVLPTIDGQVTAQKDQADTDEEIIEGALELIDYGFLVWGINNLILEMGYLVQKDGSLVPNPRGKLSIEAWFDAFEIIDNNYNKPALRESKYFQHYYLHVMEQLREMRSLMEQIEIATGYD